MVIIQSRFIGDFVIGDNIVQNLRILALQYEQFNAGNAATRRLLCKPIVVALGSIVEASLHDLHTRIRTFTIEGVKNITTSAAKEIRDLKKLDDFGKYINAAKTHDLFDAADSTLYADLDKLRLLRNRVHIQNLKDKTLPAKEYHVFTTAQKDFAERVTEKTLKTLSRKFSREHDHVDELRRPWNAYFV
ncbi:hypothetical protein ABID65_008103 [Bradyrhizobium sp. S3.9.2]|uniref:hypothetical protein n=1 Tax=Bradyrhizobium sp. S3.9.2 TaxID=3156432 RepID=UPI00339AA0A7